MNKTKKNFFFLCDYSILLVIFYLYYWTFSMLFTNVTGSFFSSLHFFSHHNYFHLLIVQRIKYIYIYIKEKNESIWRSNRVQSNMQTTTTLSSHRFFFSIISSIFFPSLSLSPSHLYSACAFLLPFFFFSLFSLFLETIISTDLYLHTGMSDEEQVDFLFSV